MTARGHLNRRMRWVGGTMYAGLGLFLAGIALGAAVGGQPLLAVSLPGFAVAFAVGMVSQFTAFRCPRCRGNLAPLVMQRGWLSVDPSVRFCPYCGRGLDEELPAGVAADAAPGTSLGGDEARG